MDAINIAQLVNADVSLLMTYRPKNCPTCNTSFQPKSPRSRYCSAECALAGSVIAIKPDTGCWVTPVCSSSTYGNISFPGMPPFAHRFAYTVVHGEIPDGQVVRHRCHYPPCANPDHLTVGSQGDNMQDSVARGTSAVGERNPAAKLTNTDAVAIYNSTESDEALAARYGVTVRTINAVRTGFTWSRVTGAGK